MYNQQIKISYVFLQGGSCHVPVQEAALHRDIREQHRVGTQPKQEGPHGRRPRQHRLRYVTTTTRIQEIFYDSKRNYRKFNCKKIPFN